MSHGPSLVHVCQCPSISHGLSYELDKDRGLLSTLAGLSHFQNLFNLTQF